MNLFANRIVRRFGTSAGALVGASVIALVIATGAVQAQVTGAGATFVFPAMAAWSSEYHKRTGIQINYQSIGSGGGIAQIKNATVDFGATERPLSRAELADFNLMQFPVVTGGIAVVVNIPGVGASEMRFTGELLADIYLGKVDRWNDPRITELNPTLRLPDRRIIVVHRSDGSGTTYVWSDYLSKMSSEWSQRVGSGTSIAWPTGLGGKGNEGVANFVGRIRHSIGYVEYAYALQTNLKYALVENADKTAFLRPYEDYFQAASAHADWENAEDFRLMLTAQPGKDSYPIVGTVWILMHKQVRHNSRARQSVEFFDWVFDEGAEIASRLHFVTMPESTVRLIREYWRANLRRTEGRPLLGG
jgi:phosphate transport system substrate-binding protein